LSAGILFTGLIFFIFPLTHAFCRTGKTGIDEEGKSVVHQIEARGTTVSIFSVDVCDREQVDRLIQVIAATLPPLRGIFQGGVVLDDVIAIHNTLSKF
jgi:KR domain